MDNVVSMPTPALPPPTLAELTSEQWHTFQWHIIGWRPAAMNVNVERDASGGVRLVVDFYDAAGAALRPLVIEQSGAAA